MELPTSHAVVDAAVRVCSLFFVLERLQFMCGVYSSCVVYTVHVWCIQFMCGVYSSCVVYTVHVWCIQFMCGVYSSCMVYTVHVWCIQFWILSYVYIYFNILFKRKCTLNKRTSIDLVVCHVM